ncbi:flagellar basal body-associated FliL family protein [Pantoea dispersa]|uniref:flagellar basal body-associated FliL family protein n=1 Tax=Pantoea dispersa TaxID=59814 RepID=UPI0028DE1D6A|nr:flagellar basal body-associated FliL family protein [Pantoea dispersa]MDT8850486.1 flagellar basal body-associated FliL family protein [Pantoea dispersa]
MVNPKTPAASRKSSPVMIIALIAALAACGMAGYLLVEFKQLSGTLAGQNNRAPAEKNLPPAEPLYVPLKTFTVSLKPVTPNDNRVIYIGLTMRVENKESKSLAEKVLPEIRSRINLLLTQHSADQLVSAEGKQSLLNSIAQSLAQPITSGQQLQVSDILLNEFIIR